MIGQLLLARVLPQTVFYTLTTAHDSTKTRILLFIL